MLPTAVNYRVVSTALFAILVFVGVWLALAAYATAEARIDALEARVERGAVKASFRLSGAFDDDFRRRLASGLPTEITYRFVLERQRRRWFDQALQSGSLQVVAMYNAITGEYLVNFKKDGTLVQSRVERNEERLRRAMMELEDVEVFSVPGTEVGRLQLRVRAELGTRTFLAFIPQTLATDWASVADLGPPA